MFDCLSIEKITGQRLDNYEDGFSKVLEKHVLCFLFFETDRASKSLCFFAFSSFLDAGA